MQQFSVTERVTRGTVVDVLMGRQVQTGERVIIEAARPEVKLTPELVRMIHEQETRRHKLEHPNLVKRVGRFFSTQRRQCWLSEPFRGESLRHRLKAKGPFAIDELLRFSMSLCDAVAYLHTHRFVHGDLSPEYIFCDTDRYPMSAKLLDTGLTLLRVDERELKVGARSLVPTEYLSPERISGQRATSSSDIYAFGIVLYELATGRPPFCAEDPEVIRNMHLSEPMPPLPIGFKSLQLILKRCLAKDQAQRFASMDQVKAELLKLHDALERAGALTREATESLRAPRPPPLPTRTVSMRQATPPEPVQEEETEPVVRVATVVRELAVDDAVPVQTLRYATRRLFLSYARPFGADVTLHVNAPAPAALGSRVRVHVTVGDLQGSFTLEGRISDVLPPIIGRASGYLITFSGPGKRAAAELVAMCADRPTSMGTSTSERVRTRLQCRARIGFARRRSVQLHDLSRTGAFLELSSLQGVRVGETLQLQLGARVLGLFGGWVSARVIWRGEKNRRDGVGVRFVDLTPAQMLTVRALYDAWAARPLPE